MQPLIPHGGEALFWAALHTPSATVSNARLVFQPTPGTEFLASQVASVSMTRGAASATEAVATIKPIDRMRCLATAAKRLAECWMRVSTPLLMGPLLPDSHPGFRRI